MTKPIEESIIGSLLINPYKIHDIIDVITSDMFTDYNPVINLILDYESRNKVWNKATIQTGCNLSQETILALIKASDPTAIYDNAILLRDKYIANKTIDLCSEYIQATTKEGYEQNYHNHLTKFDEVINLSAKKKDNKNSIFLEAIDDILSNANNKQITGLTTGWDDLDTLLGGWVNSNLIIIGARPAMGKSTIMLHHELSVAKTNTPVGILSLEMTKKELITKLIAGEAGITIQKIRAGTINDQDKHKVSNIGQELYDYPLIIEDFSDRNKVNIETISNVVKYMVRKQGVGMIIIDYLQLIDFSGNQTANYEVQNISRNLKRLAKVCNIPIIALAQLSRGIEGRTNKRPMMSDLRDSGSIEQDADIVIGLYRDEYYNPDSTDPGILEYLILKDRHGGNTFTLKRKWNNGSYSQPKTQVPF
jgi:replicative DNA helicase